MGGVFSKLLLDLFVHPLSFVIVDYLKLCQLFFNTFDSTDIFCLLANCLLQQVNIRLHYAFALIVTESQLIVIILCQLAACMYRSFTLYAYQPSPPLSVSTSQTYCTITIKCFLYILPLSQFNTIQGLLFISLQRVIDIVAYDCRNFFHVISTQFNYSY